MERLYDEDNMLLGIKHKNQILVQTIDPHPRVLQFQLLIM